MCSNIQRTGCQILVSQSYLQNINKKTIFKKINTSDYLFKINSDYYYHIGHEGDIFDASQIQCDKKFTIVSGNNIIMTQDSDIKLIPIYGIDTNDIGIIFKEIPSYLIFCFVNIENFDDRLTLYKTNWISNEWWINTNNNNMFATNGYIESNNKYLVNVNTIKIESNGSLDIPHWINCISGIYTSTKNNIKLYIGTINEPIEFYGCLKLKLDISSAYHSNVTLKSDNHKTTYFMDVNLLKKCNKNQEFELAGKTYLIINGIFSRQTEIL